jgi:hypothetical protein
VPLLGRLTPAVRRVTIAVVALAVGGVGAVVIAPLATADERADLPVAAVAMGDSIASGEAAGAYEEGTDQAGNFCHRSTRAAIAMTTIPGVDDRINLACSGAANDNVQLGGESRFGEAPQAERLREVLKDHQVKHIVLTVGANDLDFVALVLGCVKAFFLIAPRCQDVVTPQIGPKLALMVERTNRTVADIRKVMSEAGYGNEDYEFILTSYSSPITEDMRFNLTRPFQGCPFRFDDAKWARDVAVPVIGAKLATVAEDNGLRFLDLSRAMRGREVCANGVDDDGEWSAGVDIDLGQISNGLGENIVQESLHPNERGHAQLGLCMTAFAQTSDTAARCEIGPDGTLRPVPVDLGSISGSAAPHTVARVGEPTPAKNPAEAARRE